MQGERENPVRPLRQSEKPQRPSRPQASANEPSSRIRPSRPDSSGKTDRPSRLGAWSYEVHDAKLAREAKGGALLQVLLYAHLLEQVQAEAEIRGVPVIVFSTSPALLDRARALETPGGTRRFLGKPFDIAALLALVAELIGPA